MAAYNQQSGRSAPSRRELIVAAAAACCTGAAFADSPPGERVVIERVDRFRVREPNYEGVRIVLSFLGEKYSPAYVQGISGAAFRIAGICPCAPNRSTQMGTTDLLKILGYEYTESILGWTGDVDDANKNIVTLVPKIKDSVRAGRPVLLWYGFSDSAYEVVVGFDDAKGVFLGRHLHQGPREGLAVAKQARAAEAAKSFPALGGIFIGTKVGALDARAAEIAALKEAVRHAHDTKVSAQGPPRQGLACYDWWVERFKMADTKREPGDSHCHQVYRTTHRAASGFLREIAGKYPRAGGGLRAAAREFALEADALDRAAPLIGWQSPELDAGRNANLWPILAEARDHYAAAIVHVEKALPLLT